MPTIKAFTVGCPIFRWVNPASGVCGEPAFIIDGDTIVRIQTEVS